MIFKRKAKQPEFRPCPRCQAMMSTDALDCPSCGLDLREAYHPPADSTVVSVEEFSTDRGS
jgi:hypothetical protein